LNNFFHIKVNLIIQYIIMQDQDGQNNILFHKSGPANKLHTYQLEMARRNISSN
jgi:hypothetical protein